MATPIQKNSPLFERPFIRWTAREPDQTSTDFSPLLDLLLDRSGATTATVYQFDSESGEYLALTNRLPEPPRVFEVGLSLNAATADWLSNLQGPEQGDAKRDPLFERFPEVLHVRPETLLVIPLTAEKRRLGLVVLSLRSGRFGEVEIEAAEKISRFAGAVLERDTLRLRLEERKFIERAKGILQQRRGCSEEHAYLLLRNASRRRRLPMAEVAREIIETSLARPLRKTA